MPEFVIFFDRQYKHNVTTFGNITGLFIAGYAVSVVCFVSIISFSYIVMSIFPTHNYVYKVLYSARHV